MSDSKTIKFSASIPEYLKSKGIDCHYKRKFSCPSPAHDDKHPSCVTYKNPDGDYFRCFGCGLYGDIFTLVGILESLPSFKQQLNFLQDKYGSRTSKKSKELPR